MFTEDDILRALADGPKRPGEVREFLGLPERSDKKHKHGGVAIANVSLISAALQKMQAAGEVSLVKGRWQTSDTETLTVQVPKIHAAGLREFLVQVGGKVL